MPSITDVERILHHIRVKLSPNYLPTVEGAYIARTDSDKTLSMEEVCAIMKTRAGFTGKLEDLIDYVHQYNDEVAYQLCDGFAVNNGYYSIYPNIGGTFNSVNEAHDQTKNPISFRFSIRSGLRKLIDKISVDITGLADTSGWIDQFVDTDENSVNTLYTAFEPRRLPALFLMIITNCFVKLAQRQIVDLITFTLLYRKKPHTINP